MTVGEKRGGTNLNVLDAWLIYGCQFQVWTFLEILGEEAGEGRDLWGIMP